MNATNKLFTQAFQEGQIFNRGSRAVICYHDRDTTAGRMNLPRTGHADFPYVPLMHDKPMRRIAMFHNNAVAVLLEPNRLALSAQGWGGAPTTRNLLNAFLEAYRLPGYFHQKKGDFCYCERPFSGRSVFVFDLLDRRLEAVAMPNAKDLILMEVD